MEIIFLEKAQRDREYWKKSGNKAVMNKITALLEDIAKHPYTGIGKPEQLKYGLEGKWSRRIDSMHRVIYKVDDNSMQVYIYSLRYHYTK